FSYMFKTIRSSLFAAPSGQSAAPMKGGWTFGRHPINSKSRHQQAFLACAGLAHLKSSADFQSAVSRIYNLHRLKTADARKVATCKPNAIRRYSRLQICATGSP